MNIVAFFNTVNTGNIGLENFTRQESCRRRTIVVVKQTREDALKQMNQDYPSFNVPVVSGRETRKRDRFIGFSLLMRVGRPMVMHAHHGQAALLAALLRCIPKTRLVTTAHANFNSYKLRHKISFGFAFLFSDRVICNSEGTKASLPWFFKRKKALVIYNGVDFRKLDKAYSSTQKVKRKAVTVGTVCRMVPQKDLPTLLRGFAKAYMQSEVPLKLRLVGDGPERRNVARLIRELHIEEAVELAGALPRDEAYENLIDIDVFVVSSRWEGFCNAMVEAAAAGKAVIASDIDPLPEIMGYDNALFFNVGDSDALCARILELVHDQQRREALAARCREFVRERYSLDVSALKYRKVYEELAEAFGKAL